MNKTKRKILDKAQEMFNAAGVKETTLRKIALALSISQGNLNYHFKTKDEIIHSLYFELVDKMDEEMKTILHEQPLLSFLFESSYTSMACFYEYRFLMKDFYKILNASSELKSHYMGLQKLRSQQYEQLFGALVQTGIMRTALFDNEYSRLFERMNILGDNWIQVEGLFDGKSEAFVPYYHRLLFEAIFPYLTAEGRDVYDQISKPS